MIPDKVKAQILQDVCRGSSVTAAGRKSGLSGSQARFALFRLCRSLKLSPDLDHIRANPSSYSAAALRILNSADSELPTDLRRKLKDQFELGSDEEITPKSLANLTASDILRSDFSEIRLAEIQAWLVRHGYSLKPAAPTEPKDMKLALHATNVLHAFGFDVAEIRKALRH